VSAVASVRVRAPGDAIDEAEMVIGRLVVVAAPETEAVRPGPLNATEVTPLRFVPVIVAGTVVP
jgi:hypothetical protein